MSTGHQLGHSKLEELTINISALGPHLGPNMDPRWAQDGPKRAQDGPKRAEDDFLRNH